jgi:hypothetical protein
MAEQHPYANPFLRLIDLESLGKNANRALINVSRSGENFLDNLTQNFRTIESAEQSSQSQRSQVRTSLRGQETGSFLWSARGKTTY